MIDLTPLDVRKKRGDFGKGLRGYDPQEVDGFLELIAERMEVLVKENLTFREKIKQLGEKVVVQEGREQAVQEALVTAQELRQDVKKQALREAKLLEREARTRIAGMIEESEKLLTEHSSVLKESERHRDRFLKAFRTFLERELDTVEVELGRAPLEDVTPDFELGQGVWSIEEADDEADDVAASEAAEPAVTAEPVEAAETAENGDVAGAVADEPLATGSVAPEAKYVATEADEQQPPQGQDGGDSLWLSSIMMERKEEEDTK
jgi:cell division initiation protein